MSQEKLRAGIPTTYRGVTYRSRLEARWAAFFDEIEWPHTYEPFDADGYIPDFMISGDRPLLIEVKPAATYREYQDMTSYIWDKLIGYWSHDVLVLGLSPLPALGSKQQWRDVCGLLGEYQQLGDDELFSWEKGLGRWCRCIICGEVGIYHDDQSYRSRPCGHQDGDAHLSAVSVDTIRELWSTASNTTRWKAE